jgi:hypothetical protein
MWKTTERIVFLCPPRCAAVPVPGTLAPAGAGLGPPLVLPCQRQTWLSNRQRLLSGWALLGQGAQECMICMVPQYHDSRNNYSGPC